MNRSFFFHAPVPTVESWWVTTDRAHMTQAAREQQDRMNAGPRASYVNPLPRWFIDQRRKRPEHTSMFEVERAMVQMAGER